MNTPEMTGSLMFFTIGAVLVIAIVAYLVFLRKPKNRHPLPDDKPIGDTWEANNEKSDPTA